MKPSNQPTKIMVDAAHAIVRIEGNGNVCPPDNQISTPVTISKCRVLFYWKDTNRQTRAYRGSRLRNTYTKERGLMGFCESVCLTQYGWRRNRPFVTLVIYEGVMTMLS